MARFMRLEVINSLLDTGLVPLFYNGDVEISVKLAAACSPGGARVIEFTNRGELAYPVFTELTRHVAQADPGIILQNLLGHRCAVGCAVFDRGREFHRQAQLQPGNCEVMQPWIKTAREEKR